MRQQIRSIDRDLTKWVASFFSQAFHPFFVFVTLIGGPLPVVAIGAIVGYVGLLDGNTQLVFAGITVPFTLVVGGFLKLLFERARPRTEYAAGMKLQTFSFPSGHTTGSTIGYGLLAYVVFSGLSAPWGYLIGCSIAFIPVAVGVSRVYLGAHFPSDVVAGWLLGLFALIFVISVVRPLV